MNPQNPIRVLVADDSATQRRLIATVLRRDQEIAEVSEAASGREAVVIARRERPDVVVMDVCMPQLDGLAATKQIMIEAPTSIVLVSALDIEAVRTSMRALDVGALTVLHKPPTPSSPRFDIEVKRFVATIKAMARVRVVRHWPAQPPVMRAGSVEPPGAGLPPAVVAIAASTGGPAALHRLLSMLPGDFAVPILVVQHIASGFVAGLVDWLGSAGPLQVKLAQDGERMAPRRVYVAPDEHHLGVRKPATIALDRGRPMDTFCPSATHLYRSVAAAVGSQVIAVVLTGMGNDGTQGLVDVARAGGKVIAQDEGTCLVFGMPQAAIAAGVVELALPLDAIAGTLVALVTRP